MWRADELELIASPPVGKGALVLEDPGLPDTWWEALTSSWTPLPHSRRRGSRRRTL